MSGISRRRFLEQSLLAAAAIAGADGIGSANSVLSGKTRKYKGANDRIRIACIGVHGRGMDHVKGYLSSDGVDLVAICDVDESCILRAQSAIEKAGKPKPRGEQDIRKLLEDKSIDAVSIATPNHWHALAAIWAMQAGKDVYVEKPVSHNVSEGRRMVEASRKYGKICQTGTQIRSMQGSIDAIDYIHSGHIGKVTLARGLCYKRRKSIGMLQDAEVPTGVDYDIWLGAAPKRPFNPNRFHYNWHWNWDYGNGDMGNQGIHQMDVARWALNQKGLPKSVMGLGGRFGYKDDGTTPNTELAFFDYGSAQLIFEVRGLETNSDHDVMVGNIIYGSEGYVAFTGYSSAAALDKEGKLVKKFEGDGNHYGNFLDAVRSRKQSELHADIQEGHLSSALCHLGNISYRLGKSVPFQEKTKAFGDNKEAYETFARFESHLSDNGINLQQAEYHLGPNLMIDAHAERFHDSPEANAMLTREYRAPFIVPEKV